MTVKIFAVFFLSGVAVSYELVKSSRLMINKKRKLYDTASLIEERIRYTRSPIEDLIPGIEGDPECARLVDKISTSDYEEALSCAVLLKKYTEKEMESAVEKGAKERRARLFLPPCISLLVALLLI